MREEWTGNLIGKMHNHGITATEVAKELGICKAYVSFILNGSRKPPNARERLEQAVENIIKRREDGNAQNEA